MNQKLKKFKIVKDKKPNKKNMETQYDYHYQIRKECEDKKELRQDSKLKNFETLSNAIIITSESTYMNTK